MRIGTARGPARILGPTARILGPARISRGLGATLMAMLVALAGIAAPEPVEAFDGAFYPTQSIGNRGTDVRALQYLLHHRGYDVPRTGIFGGTTRSALRAFQTLRGLPVTGTTDAETWKRLATVVERGDSGDKVKAVQTLLNQKRRASLPFDGTFDWKMRSAVIGFQRHAGLPADGVVSLPTWRNLLWHYEYPAFSLTSLCDYTDTTGNGAGANWGTAAAIAQVEAASMRARGLGSGPIALGDVSREHGGDIGGHVSHEDGLDADLRPIRTDRAQCRWGTNWTWSTYDRAATRTLIRSIRATAPAHVKLIYFNDPVLVDEGLTTWYPHHDDHLHVRYCEARHPDPLYDC